MYFLKKASKKILLILQKKKILPLAKEEEKLYQNVKVRYICGKMILNFTKDKKYRKVRDHCLYASKYRDVAHSISNLKYNVPNKIPLVFNNSF